MSQSTPLPKLKLLPYKSYHKPVHSEDPVRYYYWPLLGRVYQKRVRLCLGQCSGGERVLDVGFGSGVTFLNLHEQYREIHGIDLTCDVADVTAAFATRNIPVHLINGDVTQMPYPDNHFDTVLLISILEHLKAPQLEQAMKEIRRILKPGGQLVYGVPVERPLMVFMFRQLGHNIRDHHFSTEADVREAATKVFDPVNVIPMKTWAPGVGKVYEVGHFRKPTPTENQSRNAA